MTEFPSDFEDPIEKAKPEYGVKRVKAIWASYQANGGYMGYNGRQNYAALLDLAQGNGNSTLQNLKNLFRFNNSALEQQGFSYLDLQVLNLAPKFINLVKGKLNKIEYDIILTAIDPVALDDRKAYQNKAKAYLATKEWLGGIGADANTIFADLDISSIPDEPDSLLIDMQINYKHKDAMECELELKKIHEVNNWTQIKSEISYYLTVLGIACVRTYLDKNGFEREESIYPGALVTSLATSEAYDDIEYAGHIDYITVSQFIKETAGELSDLEQEKIIKEFGAYNNNNKFEQGYIGSTFSDNLQRIPVLRFQYLTENTENYVVKTNRRTGNRDIKKQKYNFKPVASEVPLYKNGEKELISTTYTAKYGGSWVIGSDVVYNYGLQPSPRKAKNQVDTCLDYVVFAPNMQHGKVVSVMSQMIEPLFMMNAAWNRLKDIVGKGHTGFLQMELSKLAEIAAEEGAGGMKFQSKDIIDLMYQNNVVLAKGQVNQFDQSNGAAVTHIDGGLTLTDYINLFNMALEQIRNITGLNENSDASTPKTNTLNGVMEQANEATNTVLDYLYHSYHSIYRRASINLLLLSASKNPERLSLREFQVATEKKPSEEEITIFRQELQKNVAVPLEDGGLTSADVIEIFHAAKSNMKLAEQLMVARVRKNQRTARNNKAKEAEAQAEREQAAIQAATENKQAELQLEWSLKTDYRKVEHECTMAEIALKNSGATEVKQLDVDGKIEAAKQSGLDNIIREGQRSQTELRKAELDADTKHTTAAMAEANLDYQNEKDRAHDHEITDKELEAAKAQKAAAAKKSTK